MDLIPKPDQVASAASNVAHKVVYGGLADLRPMPRTLIDDGPLREVYHYRPQKKTKESGDPVLLVTPLAAPSLCYDLRRGCSLVEHFVQQGRPTYLVEYGEISFKNRRIGLEHWVDEVVPEAIRSVSEHAGGRPVHVIGWSLGGIFASLAAADRPDLPIASLTVVGTPFDVTKVPMVAPLRPILRLTDGGRGDPALPAARGCTEAARAPGLPAQLGHQDDHQAAGHPAEPRRQRVARPDRGGRPVHRQHARLPGALVRAALPPDAQVATSC